MSKHEFAVVTSSITCWNTSTTYKKVFFLFTDTDRQADSKQCITRSVVRRGTVQRLLWLWFTGDERYRVDGCGDIPGSVQHSVSRNKWRRLTDNATADLRDRSAYLLCALRHRETWNGLQLVQRAARVSQTASSHHRNLDSRRQSSISQQMIDDNRIKVQVTCPIFDLYLSLKLSVLYTVIDILDFI